MSSLTNPTLKERPSDKFCDQSSISNCLECLSNELHIMGFHRIDTVGVSCDLVKLINVFWSVIQQHKEKIKKINELNERLWKLESEKKTIDQSLRYQGNTIRRTEKELNDLKVTLNKTLTEKDIYSKKLNETKVEIAKLNSALITNRLQHENDLRKHEVMVQNLQFQIFKMQESNLRTRLPKLLKKECLNNPNDVSMSSNLSLLQKCMSQLDNNIKLLLTENASIRSCLLNIYNEILGLHQMGSVPNEECSWETSKTLLLLPYEELVQKIYSSVESIIPLIKKNSILQNEANDDRVS